jgi:hypothetical protein
MKIKNFLLLCDFLGKQQRFTIANRSTFPTYIGVICSFIVVGICTFFTVYFTLEVFKKNKPNLLTTVYNEANPERTNLTKETYMFAFSLQDVTYKPFINESLYTAEAFHTEIFRKGDGETEEIATVIPVKRCSDITISLLPEYFNLLELDNLYCLELADMDLYIQGDYGTQIWSYLRINFKKCENTTEESKCVPEEEIMKQLSSGFVGAFSSDLTVVANDYKNPSNIYGKNIFTSYSVNQYLTYWVYYKKIKLSTDYGWLFHTYEYADYFAYETTKENLEQRSESIFIDMILRLSQTKEVYERSYYKIHEVAADVGGIMKVCLVVGELLVYFFRETLYKDYILSFFYGDDVINSLNKQKSRISIIESNTMKSKMSNNVSVYNSRGANNDVLPSGTLSQDNYKDKSDMSSNHNIITPITQNHKRNINIFTKCSDNKMFSDNPSMFIEQVPEKNKSMNAPEKEFHISQPKTSLSTIIDRPKHRLSSWMLLGPCLWNKKVKHTIKNINKYYLRISYLFDVIHFLKTKNDVVIMKKKLFETVVQTRKANNKDYRFQMSSAKDKDDFDYSVNIKMK